MPRLFALDKNFPQPIVSVLSDFQADATLIPLAIARAGDGLPASVTCNAGARCPNTRLPV